MVAELDRALLQRLGTEVRHLVGPLRVAQGRDQTDCAFPMPTAGPGSASRRPASDPRRLRWLVDMDDVGIASLVAADVGCIVASVTLALLGRAGAFDRGDLGLSDDLDPPL